MSTRVPDHKSVVDALGRMGAAPADKGSDHGPSEDGSGSQLMFMRVVMGLTLAASVTTATLKVDMAMAQITGTGLFRTVGDALAAPARRAAAEASQREFDREQAERWEWQKSVYNGIEPTPPAVPQAMAPQPDAGVARVMDGHEVDKAFLDGVKADIQRSLAAKRAQVDRLDAEVDVLKGSEAARKRPATPDHVRVTYPAAAPAATAHGDDDPVLPHYRTAPHLHDSSTVAGAPAARVVHVHVPSHTGGMEDDDEDLRIPVGPGM